MLYVAARVGLVLVWSFVAVVCLKRRRAGGEAGWLVCAVAAALFATMRATRWNWHLLLFARGRLRDWGVYSDRMWLKVTLGICLIVGLFVGLMRARRWYGEQPPNVRRAGLPLLLMGLFIIVLTFSLDGFLPRFVYDQPGRYLLEYGLALVTLAFVGVPKGRA